MANLNDSTDLDDLDECQWFVIDSEKDLCVVPEPDVDYDEEISLGYNVPFFYRKKRYNGIVRFIADNPESCEREAMRLANLPRRQPSFHSDQPRKAAQQCNLRLKNKTTAAKEKKKTLVDNSVKIADKELLESYDDGEEQDNTFPVDEPGPFSDDQSESKQAPTPTRSSKSKKPSDKKARLYSERDSGPRGKENLKKRRLENELSNSSNDKPRSLGSCFSEESERQTLLKQLGDFDVKVLQQFVSSRNKPLVSSTPFSSRRPKVTSRISQENSFQGVMYVHTELNESSVEVFEQSNVYCEMWSYDFATSSTSATQVARRLLEGVFSFEALTSCSVSGLPPRGKGRNAYSSTPSAIKPHLCPRGVNAIVCRSLQLQKKKHFLKKKDESQIRNAMGVRLNEIQTEQSRKRNLV